MINPVLYREIKTSLRTWKTYIAISVYVLLLAIVAGGSLLLASRSYYSGFNPKNITNIYIFLSGFQLGLITLIVPALAGSAISGERERQTFDLMLVTKMSTFSIVIGKLMSSLLVALLMIAASIPVFGVILYYGGLSLPELMVMFGFLMCSACMIGSVSIFFSSIFKRTVISIVMTYVVMLFLSLGTLIVLAFIYAMLSNYSNPSSLPAWIEWITYAVSSVNPFLGFASVMSAQMGQSDVSSYVIARGLGYSAPAIGLGASMSLWMTNILFDLAVSLVLLFASSRIIMPRRGKRLAEVKQQTES